MNMDISKHLDKKFSLTFHVLGKLTKKKKARLNCQLSFPSLYKYYFTALIL